MIPCSYTFDYSEIAEALFPQEGWQQHKSEGLGSNTSHVCEQLVAALGPSGLGIVAIRGVPGVEELRAQLLPLASQLAAFPKSELLTVLKRHGLGTDTPFKSGRKRNTSFAGQCRFSVPVLPNRIPKAALHADSIFPLLERHTDGSRNEVGENETVPLSRERAQSPSCDTFTCVCLNCAYWMVPKAGQKGVDANSTVYSHQQCNGCMFESGKVSPSTTCTATTTCCDDSTVTLGVQTSARCKVEQVGDLFQSLGAKLVTVSALVARVCDLVLGEQSCLEEVMNEAKMAKGRLIHYHPCKEEQEEGNASVKYKIAEERKGQLKVDSNVMKWEGTEDRNGGADLGGIEEVLEGEKALWQEWHYDFGLFTTLTSPLYSEECVGLDRRESGGGLHVLDPKMGSVVPMEIPHGCVGVQVGEAAQILSGGKLRAAAHCVKRGRGLRRSREMFVVFTQPRWDALLVSPQRGEGSDCCINEAVSNNECIRHAMKANCNDSSGNRSPLSIDEEFVKGVIPPLEDRWQEGMTFAEFSKETTKQYYGTTKTSPYMASHDTWPLAFATLPCLPHIMGHKCDELLPLLWSSPAIQTDNPHLCISDVYFFG